MSENSLRSVLERALDMKRNGAGNEFWDEWEQQAAAALAATQEPQPQRDERLLSLANAIWDVMGLGRSEQADIQRIFDVLDKRLPRAAGAPAASGREPAWERLYAKVGNWVDEYKEDILNWRDAELKAAAPRPELAPARTRKATTEPELDADELEHLEFLKRTVKQRGKK